MHVRKDGLTATYLVRSFRDRERAADVRRAAAIHHAVVHDEVANNTDRVVQSTFCFVNDLRKVRAASELSK